MKFNLDNPLHREQFKRRCNALYRSRSVVELTERRQRTLPQNSYIHLAIAYLATLTGVTADYAKEHYFKRGANRDMFVTRAYDPVLDTDTDRLRSSSALTKEEMSVAIDRFLDWAGQHGYYIPPPDRHHEVAQMDVEVSRAARFL